MEKVVLNKINKQTFISVPILALASGLLFESKLVAFNVFIGGLISWLSLRELAWAVKKFFGKPGFQFSVIGLSYVKLGLIFIFLWFIAMQGLFNIYGLLIGFISVLAISAKEAYLYVRRQTQ